VFRLDEDNKKLVRVASSGRCGLDRIHRHLLDDEVRTRNGGQRDARADATAVLIRRMYSALAAAALRIL
jgi:hypothetical protein